MNFYNELEQILIAGTPSEKIAQFRRFYSAYCESDVCFVSEGTPVVFEKPSYAGFCTIVPPLDVPKRKKLSRPEGQILLLHAIAHIEYSAIDLALDAAYRFRGMPKDFYDDWLEVADDEVRHFEMIEKLLNELGSSYGKVPVHDALFETSQKTLNLLERMAVVPRYLEANGLDATPQILKRLEPVAQQPFVKKIAAALDVILREEVGHVAKGDRWFSYACDEAGEERAIYFKIIEEYFPNSFPKTKGLNIDARKEAGFSCSELNTMTSEHIC